MRLLELFSGTHSVGRKAKELGWEVTSVDISDYNGKYPPTFLTDILDWDYKVFPPDHFDVVWCSPPCVFYCRLQHINLNKKKANGTIWTKADWERDMAQADRLVQRALDIVAYFMPHKWFLENPQTGFLKDRKFMKDIPFVDVDFCRYCDWGYRKRTRIWTNVETFAPLLCNRRCGNMDESGKKHRLLQRKGKGQTTKIQRYRIPPKLVEALLAC